MSPFEEKESKRPTGHTGSKSILLAMILVLLVVVTAGQVHADVITVLNPSFEILPAGGLPNGGCGAGCSFSIDNIPGWVVNPAIGSSCCREGQIHPGTPGNTSVVNSVPDGSVFAYAAGGFISQNVGNLIAGVTYTLQVDIGSQKFSPYADGVSIGFHAGACAGANATSSPTLGNWATATATYVSPAGDPCAGLPLTIELFGSVANANSNQGDFDNVRFSNNLSSPSAVPEPGSLALLGTALIAIALVRRRRVLRSNLGESFSRSL